MHAGKLMTISLWDSAGDASAAETRAAQIRSKAVQAIGAAAPAIDTYQVEVAVLA